MDMTLPSGSARNRVIDRLKQDLIGPRAEDEVLDSRPSDIYLTGILWPKNSKIAPEEDERLAVAPGEGEEGEDAGDEAVPASVPMRRPSTAGVSFAAASKDHDYPSVSVSIECARYEPCDTDGVQSWRRLPLLFRPEPIQIRPDAGNIPLEIAELPGLRLNLRAARFDRGMLATMTLVNEAVPGEAGRDALEQVTLFQVTLTVAAVGGSTLIARPSRRTAVDEDDRIGDLLYRHASEYATGHTCSAEWIRKVTDGVEHAGRCYPGHQRERRQGIFRPEV